MQMCDSSLVSQGLPDERYHTMLAFRLLEAAISASPGTAATQAQDKRMSFLKASHTMG